MHYIIGERLVRRRVGYVGDFCPFCRQLSRLEAVRMRKFTHINYLSVIPGKLVAIELSCRACDTLRAAEPESVSPVRRFHGDVPDLIARTNPAALDSISRRLELESRLGDLSLAERHELLVEPFVAHNYAAHSRTLANGDTAATMLLIALCAIGLSVSFTLTTVAIATSPTTASDVIAACVSVLLTALALRHTFIGIRGLFRRRRQSRHDNPAIARALQPLRPTNDEIEWIFVQLRTRRLTIADLLSPARVQRMMDESRRAQPDVSRTVA